MKITGYLIVAGLATALGIGAACGKSTSEGQSKAPMSPPPSSSPSPSASPTPSAPPSSAAPDKQPVSGSELSFVTDDGKKTEIKDTAAITQVQQKLAKEGLYAGSIDGKSSPELT